MNANEFQSLSNDRVMADMAYNRLTRKEQEAFLRDHLGRREEGKEPEALLRRQDVAKRLGVSLRAVDMMAKDGILTKVRFPRRTRCAGFRKSEIDAFLADTVQSAS